MDVLDRADLPFPHSLPEFQRLFPDDAACAAYLEKARWGDGFACPHCGTAGEPFHFENRPGVLRCRKCRQNTGLTVGTVMERSHTPLNVWFWAAYLVASQTPGMSAVQFQRQLGLSRYETAFQILHKLRSGMVRPNQDRIGGQPKNHVEVDETWVGGRTRGEGRSPQGSRLLCHRGASSKAGHQARQPERRTLCRTRSARRRGKAVVFTTRFPSPVPSRCVIESRAPSSTTGKTDAMPDAFGSPSCSTVAPSRSVGSSRAPSRRDR